ncbi:MAG TPA: response regulator [Polyangiaceae bacterium]|nr:response regulator [Polyangiaceae bacterium]
MSSSTSEGAEQEGGRLGGARADFVGSLGRKLADARDLLSALEDDPSSKLVRDELRRRLHALGAGARLLKFEAMARSLQEILVVLEHAGEVGVLRESDVALVGQMLDDLPALAWGEAVPRESPLRPGEEGDETAGHPPLTVLVVGGEDLADALMDEGVGRTRGFECERTEDVDNALQLARAYAPDLVLVDADLPRASGLVEALLDDPLTEPVPVIVVGTFRVPHDAARFVALGVAKSLARPVTAEVIRGTCDEILDARAERTLRMTLGEPTVEQLADRLAEELRRALVDGVDKTARARRIPLGEGTEVLGALWGAIARVQEIVAQRTGGAVRFGGGTPDGAIALAPWLHHDVPGAERMAARGRGTGADVRLKGRRVVVADDDPGVTWFISDLLRMAGCEVYEALDGRTALDLAFHVQPELVVSDILMPGLDGFALSRALRRDVALRDTPVILLSWKEDLLQRVRELGASAAAYMRKESDSRAVLARVREVLRPRARIEMRLRGDGEVRGRLDGLSPRLLLELVGIIRRDARIAMRDAMFLYEVDVRGGAPRKITRTASDGSYQSGERALASLLGVGAGRFVVASTSEPVRGDLTGTLFEQLARPIAAARGALESTTGASTVQVERVAIDEAVLDEYLRATPDPARTVIQRLAAGVSPRQMLIGGEASPALLEDVLADLAARGAIRAVEGANGSDLLSPAVDAALAVMRGVVRSGSVIPPNARPSAPMVAASVKKGPSGPAPPSGSTPTAAPSQSSESAPPTAVRPRTGEVTPSIPVALESPPSPAYEAFHLTDPPPPPAADDENDAVPSSLEDAVMREISDRSPHPGPAHASSTLRSIVEPSELRPRSSNPPEDLGDEVKPLPSIPPDAVVPGAPGSEAATTPGAVTESDRALPVRKSSAAAVSAENQVSPGQRQEQEEPDGADGPYSAPFEISTPDADAPLVEVRDAAPPVDGASASRRTVRPEDGRGGPLLGARAAGMWALVLLVLGGAVVAGLYLGRDSSDASPAASASPTAGAIPSDFARSPAPTVPTLPPRVDTEDLPAGAEVPPGYGYLEVRAAPEARVRIDGSLIGAGPVAGGAVSPGYHEVVVEQGGRATSRQVAEVRAGKTTRVRVVALP